MQVQPQVQPQGFLAFERTVAVFSKLIALETEILETIVRLEKHRRLTEPQGNGASMNHPADLSYRDTIDDVTLEMDRTRLTVIVRAKAKLLYERSYGKCDDCRDEIPEERLEFRPEAVRCCSCQKNFEAQSGMSRRRYH